MREQNAQEKEHARARNDSGQEFRLEIQTFFVWSAA
jgi:hypothetical protein